MGKALELVDGSRFEKAGVICVSDGIGDVSPEDQAEWTMRRSERGMRAYGVLNGV
jgi:coproporphyrinogen III oxidase